MSFPKYPAYKDTRVAWLGAVPTHWAVTPLKYLASFRSGGTPDKANPDYWNGDVPWASAKDMKTDHLLDTSDHITSTAIEDGAASLVSPGTVLVVVRGMILARMFPVVTARVPMAINQDLKAVLAGPEVRSEFLAWLLRGAAPESLSRLDEAGHGTKALRMDAWAQMQLPVPSLDEQGCVVTFLDHETAKIDALVEEQRRLIELLKEKRQAVISHAVTKGLDPSVPMKDSGVEWLGKVPATWEVKRLRDSCASISTGPFGTALGSGDYIDGGVPVVNPSHIVGNRIVPDDAVSVSDEAADRLSFWALRVGDIVVARRGELGRAAVVESECGGWICGTGSLRVTPNTAGATAAFLHAVLQSTYAREWLNQSSVGSTMANLNEGILGRLPIALPTDTAEQAQLTNALFTQLSGLGEVEMLAEECVARLQERRSALISAAVTGKIDVRGFAPTPESAAA